MINLKPQKTNSSRFSEPSLIQIWKADSRVKKSRTHIWLYKNLILIFYHGAENISVAEYDSWNLVKYKKKHTTFHVIPITKSKDIGIDKTRKKVIPWLHTTSLFENKFFRMKAVIQQTTFLFWWNRARGLNSEHEVHRRQKSKQTAERRLKVCTFRAASQAKNMWSMPASLLTITANCFQLRQLWVHPWCSDSLVIKLWTTYASVIDAWPTKLCFISV